MKIRFSQTRVVQNRHAGSDLETRYEAGHVYDLPAPQALRWIARGVAAPEPAAPTTPAPRTAKKRTPKPRARP